MIGDIDGLVGRSFVSKSNNICKMQRIGAGAVRAFWNRCPSAQDIEECNQWIESFTGPADLAINIGKKTEVAAYRKWLSEK